MTEIQTIIDALWQILKACGTILNAAGASFASHWVLVLWIAFWVWCVRWTDLRAWLRQGAWAAFAVLSVFVGIVWGICSEPTWQFGLPSIIEKVALVGLWIGLAFICGKLQTQWNCEPQAIEIAGPPEGAAAGHGHGHDDHGHGGHGHDSHGHGGGHH